jgi:hypothetical protein
MRIHPRAIPALGVVVLIGAAVAFAPELTGQGKPIPADCNRACLEGLMEQYLAALVARDPKRLRSTHAARDQATGPS